LGYRNEPVVLVALRSAAMLTGLGILSSSPIHAVRLGPGSEAAFRGPWQPPRFFLPYWSLLALVVMAASIVIDGHRSSVVYGFSAFAGATALVVVRQLLTIRENYKLFTRLAEADERRQTFLRELLKGVEEERIRVANSIDTGPVQQLTALMLRAQRAATRETTHPKLLIEALTKQLSVALEELRELTRSLRPSLTEARDLAEAIALEVKEAFSGAPVTVELDVEEPPGLAPEQQLHLFRIAEEAIDNVRMHAGASKVQVTLKSERGLESSQRRVVLEVKDDGKGFVERVLYTRTSIVRTGISSMRERADILGADLQLISTPGAGTIVRVLLDLPQQIHSAQRHTKEPT